MADWKAISARFTEILGLENKPVGTRYTNRPPQDVWNRKLPACMSILNAKRGKTVLINSKTSLCPGGAYYLGFAESHDPKALEFLSRVECIFSGRATAKNHLMHCPPPALGIAQNLLLAPLESYPIAKGNPELVLFFVNPAQASDLFGLVAYYIGKPCSLTSFGATCRSSIGNPYSTGEPDISFIDVSARNMGNYSENELIVSLPERYARLAYEAIDHSTCGAKETAPIADLIKDMR
ncbi:DUF169 domain-containing protein [Thermodesulfobacteriota bacterium]